MGGSGSAGPMAGQGRAVASWSPALLGQGLTPLGADVGPWARGAGQGRSGVVVPRGHWQQLLETNSLAKAMTFCNVSSTKKVLRRNLTVFHWAALPAHFPMALGFPYPVPTAQAVGSQPSCQPWRAWLLPQSDWEIALSSRYLSIS